MSPKAHALPLVIAALHEKKFRLLTHHEDAFRLPPAIPMLKRLHRATPFVASCAIVEKLDSVIAKLGIKEVTAITARARLPFDHVWLEYEDFSGISVKDHAGKIGSMALLFERLTDSPTYKFSLAFFATTQSAEGKLRYAGMNPSNLLIEPHLIQAEPDPEGEGGFVTATGITTSFQSDIMLEGATEKFYTEGRGHKALLQSVATNEEMAWAFTRAMVLFWLLQARVVKRGQMQETSTRFKSQTRGPVVTQHALQTLLFDPLAIREILDAPPRKQPDPDREKRASPIPHDVQGHWVRRNGKQFWRRGFSKGKHAQRERIAVVKQPPARS